jgi:hypothetical protein
MKLYDIVKCKNVVIYSDDYGDPPDGGSFLIVKKF